VISKAINSYFYATECGSFLKTNKKSPFIEQKNPDQKQKQYLIRYHFISCFFFCHHDLSKNTSSHQFYHQLIFNLSLLTHLWSFVMRQTFFHCIETQKESFEFPSPSLFLPPSLIFSYASIVDLFLIMRSLSNLSQFQLDIPPLTNPR